MTDSQPMGIDKRTGKSYAICGSPKKSGGICENNAGKNTDHLGVGRCFLHGGRNQSPSAKNYKHGLNAKIHYGDILERVKELREQRDVFDMRSHIFLLEAILEDVLKNSNTTEEAFPSVVKAVDTATKAIQRLHEVEVGRRYVISVENVGSLIDKISQVIERHVTDPYARALIAEDLMKVYRTPQPSLLISHPPDVINAE